MTEESYYDTPEFREAYDKERSALDAMKADIGVLEAEITTKMGALPVGQSQMIDDPEFMDQARRNGHAYPDEIDDLDGDFRTLANMQEALNRREHDLGYW